MVIESILSYIRKFNKDGDIKYIDQLYIHDLLSNDPIQMDEKEVEYFREMINLLNHNKLMRLQLNELDHDIELTDMNELGSLFQKCDKLCGNVTQRLAALAKFKGYLMVSTQNTQSMEPLLKDSKTLLFQIWSILLRDLNNLKVEINLNFVFFKCLIIKSELYDLNKFLESNKGMHMTEEEDISNSSITSNVISIKNVASSFKGCLIQLASEIKETLDGNDRITNFEYFLRAYTKIEELYAVSNFNWLLFEIQTLQLSKQQFNSSVQIMPIQSATFENQETNLIESNTEKVDSISDFNDETKTEKTTGNEPEVNHVNNNISLKVKTPLQQELPNLLSAFHVAKNLEQDLDRVSNLYLGNVGLTPKSPAFLNNTGNIIKSVGLNKSIHKMNSSFQDSETSKQHISV